MFFHMFLRIATLCTPNSLIVSDSRRTSFLLVNWKCLTFYPIKRTSTTFFPSLFFPPDFECKKPILSPSGCPPPYYHVNFSLPSPFPSPSHPHKLISDNSRKSGLKLPSLLPHTHTLTQTHKHAYHQSHTRTNT